MGKGLVKLTMLLCAGAMVVACSSSDDSSSASGAYAYIGEWETGCVKSLQHPEDPNLYVSYRLRFNATEWHYVFAAYVDEECTSQRLETADIDRTTYTLTIAGTYFNSGVVTTADGLQANNLTINVTSDTTTNTSDNPDDESDTAIGASADILIYVDDANVLYAGESLLGTSEDTGEVSGKLVLSLPFIAVE